MKVKSLSHVRLFAIPWTAAYQAPPSMGFCRQEYWSGVPLPSPSSSTEKWKSDKHSGNVRILDKELVSGALTNVKFQSLRRQQLVNATY